MLLGLLKHMIRMNRDHVFFETACAKEHACGQRTVVPFMAASLNEKPRLNKHGVRQKGVIVHKHVDSAGQTPKPTWGWRWMFGHVLELPLALVQRLWQAQRLPLDTMYGQVNLGQYGIFDWRGIRMDEGESKGQVDYPCPAPDDLFER